MQFLWQDEPNRSTANRPSRSNGSPMLRIVPLKVFNRFFVLISPGDAQFRWTNISLCYNCRHWCSVMSGYKAFSMSWESISFHVSTYFNIIFYIFRACWKLTLGIFGPIGCLCLYFHKTQFYSFSLLNHDRLCCTCESIPATTRWTTASTAERRKETSDSGFPAFRCWSHLRPVPWFEASRQSGKSNKNPDLLSLRGV